VSHESRKHTHVFEAMDEYIKRAEYMFERVFVSSWNEATQAIEPLYYITVGSSEIIVTVDLPYVNPEDVTLTLPAEDTVEVYANTKRRITFADLGVRHRGGQFKCYHVRIHVPVSVVELGMTSRFKRGVLEIHLRRLV
jgi:HSP20 family molecular chaperone IbpA